jgi:hypothetical protein
MLTGIVKLPDGIGIVQPLALAVATGGGGNNLSIHVSQVRIKVVMVAEIMESPNVARSLYVYKSLLATHR